MTKDEELDELYMVVGALCFMVEGLKKCGTVANAEKAKQYEALVKKYDTRFLMLMDDVSIAAPAAPGEKEKGRL